jgi:hypothetical protein
MDRLTRVLAGLLGRSAGLLPGRRAEYKHDFSVGHGGRTPFAFLLVAPIIGIVLGGVAAAAASAGLPRPVPSGARPGPGNDGRRATAPGDA